MKCQYCRKRSGRLVFDSHRSDGKYKEMERLRAFACEDCEYVAIMACRGAMKLYKRELSQL